MWRGATYAMVWDGTNDEQNLRLDRRAVAWTFSNRVAAKLYAVALRVRCNGHAPPHYFFPSLSRFSRSFLAFSMRFWSICIHGANSRPPSAFIKFFLPFVIGPSYAPPM